MSRAKSYSIFVEGADTGDIFAAFDVVSKRFRHRLTTQPTMGKCRERGASKEKEDCVLIAFVYYKPEICGPF